MNSTITTNLLQFIHSATSPFHVILESKRLLEQQSFLRLDITKPWNLIAGTCYYVPIFDSSFFAFSIAPKIEQSFHYRIIAAHTDQPCLRLKPISEKVTHNYLKVNASIYGGAIYNTWLDRPLSIAGKVALKSSSIFQPEIRFLDIQKPLLTIPNLAIHINRETNKGIALNPQIDMQPIIGLVNDYCNKDNYIIEYLAQQLKVDPNSILDFDLYVYNAEQGTVLGLGQEFLSCPRLDNLTSVFGAITALIQGHRENGINVIALFDHEEIGSRSKQGADSCILTMVLKKIQEGLLHTTNYLQERILQSVFISADVAHAIHPNHPEKYDPSNYAQFQHGITIKIDGNQKYATDSHSIAIIQQLCKQYSIPFQKYVNRSDMPSGSTLGPLVSSLLPMKTIDIGIPILAMHSARELMCIQDQVSLHQLLTAFFSHIDN